MFKKHIKPFQLKLTESTNKTLKVGKKLFFYTLKNL